MTSHYRVNVPSSLIGNSVMAATKFACLDRKKVKKEMEFGAEILTACLTTTILLKNTIK
jgi:hypothetical protein